MNNLIDTIHTLDLKDLDKVVEAINRRRTFLTKMNIRKINIGDKVQFRNNSNQLTNGIVTKINRKTVELVEQLGPNRSAKWKVHASLISKI